MLPGAKITQSMTAVRLDSTGSGQRLLTTAWLMKVQVAWMRVCVDADFWVLSTALAIIGSGVSPGSFLSS